MEIDQWRRDYLRGGLQREDLRPEPMDQFRKWLADAAESDLSDPSAMCLATVDSSGQPSQRIVLLKGFDGHGFVFYTNLQSRKARDLEASQRVSLLFPWQMLERQVIVRGRARLLDREEALAYFRTRPRESQLAAWASPQSRPIESRAELMQAFEAVRGEYEGGEVPLPDFWGGYRVTADEIEFWQGGASRLHDRFIYRLQADGRWKIERLAP